MVGKRWQDSSRKLLMLQTLRLGPRTQACHTWALWLNMSCMLSWIFFRKSSLEYLKQSINDYDALIDWFKIITCSEGDPASAGRRNRLWHRLGVSAPIRRAWAARNGYKLRDVPREFGREKSIPIAMKWLSINAWGVSRSSSQRVVPHRLPQTVPVWFPPISDSATPKCCFKKNKIN